MFEITVSDARAEYIAIGTDPDYRTTALGAELWMSANERPLRVESFTCGSCGLEWDAEPADVDKAREHARYDHASPADVFAVATIKITPLP